MSVCTEVPDVAALGDVEVSVPTEVQTPRARDGGGGGTEEEECDMQRLEQAKQQASKNGRQLHALLLHPNIC
eukprot:g6005.t1